MSDSTTTKARAPGSTVIAHCSCTNAYQDERYGEGLRVHNVMGDGKRKRCGSCKAER